MMGFMRPLQPPMPHFSSMMMPMASPEPMTFSKLESLFGEEMDTRMESLLGEQIDRRSRAPTDHVEVSFEDSEGHQWQSSSDVGMLGLPQSLLSMLGLQLAPPRGNFQFIQYMPQPSPLPFEMEMRPSMEMRPPSHPCQVEVERCVANGVSSRSEIQCCLASHWDVLSGTCKAFMEQVLDKEALDKLTMENRREHHGLRSPPMYEDAPHIMRSFAPDSSGPFGHSHMPDHMPPPPHHHGPLCMLLMPSLIFLAMFFILRRCLGLSKTQPQFAAFVEPEPVSIKTRLEPLMAHDIAKATAQPVQA